MRNIWAAVFLLGRAASAFAQDLPSGWRLPTANELADEPLRKDSPTKFAKAVADFNGDGVNDEALLLKSTRFSGEGLWIKLSEGKDRFRWVKLNEIRWGEDRPRVDLAMGIELVSPGVHAYGCFDGVKECDFDPKNRPKLRLKDPSLLYFRFESAASLFFWSHKSKRFLRVWTSD